MTMHLSDDDLHDYAGGELPPGEMARVAAHLDDCAACRALAEPLVVLTARLAALPRLATPASDGWAALHARLVAEETAATPAPVAVTKVVSLDGHRRRRGRMLGGWVPQAAAAALLLGIGFGGGRMSRPADSASAMAIAADTVATAMQAAVRVQRAGTEYVAAVAHFVAATRGSDSLVAAQGREATIAACYGASRELTRLRGGDSSAVQLFRTASITRHGRMTPADTAPRPGVMF
ncbi:anti-sigma factor family protein [Longimicrobium sp.]|uniref:anti-sigma factor family protein n=1 Tax=Longimicrobium sp. TaxID=2029185 RepID=UPI002E328369|nr:zf-HC2 domain-containing protein [Longimicrobium sp.]HEX6037599.1 zf-HC2 domain-containing protein [Longimicrobium sp.]